MSLKVNWSNIDLKDAYERNLALIDELTFDTLLLEIECNIKDINAVTVTEQFEKDLQSRIEESRSIFKDNVDNIVKDAIRRRKEH